MTAPKSAALGLVVLVMLAACATGQNNTSEQHHDLGETTSNATSHEPAMISQNITTSAAAANIPNETTTNKTATAPTSKTKSTTSHEPAMISKNITTSAAAAEIPNETTTTNKTATASTLNAVTKPTSTNSTTPSSTTANVPVPQRVNWTWTDNNTTIPCIHVEMTAQLNITYNYNTSENNVVDITSASKVISGCCNCSKQYIQAALPKGNITLQFDLTDTQYELADVILSLDLNGTVVVLQNLTEFFVVPRNFSYKCALQQEIVLSVQPQSKILDARLIVSNVQMEAFHQTNNSIFSNAKDCQPPASVGCALAASMAALLIALFATIFVF